MGLDVLKKWKPVFSQSTFLLTDILHQLGWWLVLGLKYLCDASQTLVDEMYKLLDFTQYGNLTKIFSANEVRILLGILFAFALIVLGVTLIWQKDKEKPKVIQNVLIAVLIITALPSLMTMLNDLTLDAKDAILGTQSKMSDQLIADNVVDLLYIDSKGFDKYNISDGKITGGAVNGFSAGSDNIKYIDICEKVTDKQKNELNSPEYFFNVIGTNKDGAQAVQELKSNKFLGIDFTGWYYRYHVDYLVIYISLLATTVAFFFVAFKVAKLIFDLAVHGVLATVFAASDLTNGQRTKQVLQSIGSIYVVLVLAVLMIKFYYLGSSYISSTISNGLVKAIALIFFAFAVIDGPNIIEKILGIDVGLRSGFQTLATMFMATSAVKSVVGGAGHLAGGILGGAFGTVGGIKDGVNNYRNERANMLNNQDNNNSVNESQNNSPSNNLYGDNKSDEADSSNNTQNVSNNNVNEDTSNGKNNLNGSQEEAAPSLNEDTNMAESESLNNLHGDNDIENIPQSDVINGDNLNASPMDINRDSNLNNNAADEAVNGAFNIPKDFNGTINIDNSTNNIQGTSGRRSAASSSYHAVRDLGGEIGKKAGQLANKRDLKNLSKGDDN